jgi:hypothetical protein
MTYSKIHQKFSKYLKQPDALTNPEKYLGPNWKDVLNFWIYVDTLSVEEKEEMGQRYQALKYKVRYCAIDDARNAAEEVVGREFRCEAWCASCGVTGRVVFGDATYELIAHHLFINKSIVPIFLELIIYTK